VPEEEYIKEQSHQQENHGNYPDDQGECHGAQNDRCGGVSLGKNLEIDKELNDWRASCRCVSNEIGFNDRPQRERVDDLSRAFSAKNTKTSWRESVLDFPFVPMRMQTFSFKVDEQRDPGSLLLALGQLSEDEVPSPTTIEPDTLQYNGERVQVVFRDTFFAHDAKGTKPLVYGNDPREDDAACKYPFRDLEVDFGFEVCGPFVVF
jgi:hypothetical protein